MPDNSKHGIFSPMSEGHADDMHTVSSKAELENILGEQCVKLKDIITRTESDFSGFSSRLQSLYFSAKNITELSVNAAKAISGEVIQNSISEIDRMLQLINIHLESSDTDIDKGKLSLQSIMVSMHDITDHLEGFNRVVKHLRMLGISTKIENARLKVDATGFNVLAENVELLSTVIQEKTTSVRKHASSLISGIQDVNRRILYLQKTQREQEEKILRDTKTSLQWLMNKYEMSYQKTDTIAQTSAHISSNVGQVITSVQFHDITRQQMEHVIEALGELQRMIQSRQSDENELKNSIGDVCHLQSAQLEHTETELSGAIRNIIGNLSEVSKLIDGISGAARELMSSSGSEDSSFIGRIESGLSSVSDALLQNTEVRREFSASVMSVSDTVEDLTRQVNQIDEVGSEIEMIALNARIKAARTGNEGAALDVLAEGIQNLSATAKEQTRMVVDSLKRITDATVELEEITDSDKLESKNQGLLELTRSIARILNELKVLEDETAGALRKIDKESSAFRSSTDKEITALEGYIDLSASIRVISGSLSSAAYNFGSAGIRSEFNNDYMSRLNDKYTMMSERQIHERLSGVNKRQNSFSGCDKSANDIKNTESPGYSDQSDDLGDNVELF